VVPEALLAGAPPGRLVIVSAHPDDETLGAGRLVSQWRRTIGPVSAVLATAGEACVDHVMPRPRGLAQRRLEEWKAALSCLGVTDRIRLGLPDGRLEAAERTLTDQWRRRIDDLGEPAALAAPCRVDPHPDHRALGRAAAAVAAKRGISLLEYPVWLSFWAQPDVLGAGRLIRVRTDADAESARTRALACYVSQLAPLADDLEPVVPKRMLEHHREQRLVWANEYLSKART
jgi:LmbE family N-acetylglucosaminyl deacetylase